MNEKENAIFVGTVDDTFVISGRKGVIVVPVERWAIDLKVNEELYLEKPDGAISVVKIAAFELVNATHLRGRVPVLLTSNNLSKDDVPIGSTLWKVS